MSTVKTFYAQVPLGIAMKNIARHQQNELIEESLQEEKRNLEMQRPARTSAGKGAERVRSMSN